MSYVHITAVFTYIFAECIRTWAINKMMYVWCSPSSPIGPRGWPNVYIIYIYIYIMYIYFWIWWTRTNFVYFYHFYLLGSRIRCVGKLPHARPWARIWLTWSRDSFPERLWCHSAGERYGTVVIFNFHPKPWENVYVLKIWLTFFSVFEVLNYIADVFCFSLV